MKLPDLTYNNDPDVIKADEAWSGEGKRNLRVVRIKGDKNGSDDLLYMDARDVNWVMEQCNAALTRWRLLFFWSQVAIVAMMYSMAPSEFARLMYE